MNAHFWWQKYHIFLKLLLYSIIIQAINFSANFNSNFLVQKGKERLQLLEKSLIITTPFVTIYHFLIEVPECIPFIGLLGEILQEKLLLGVILYKLWLKNGHVIHNSCKFLREWKNSRPGFESGMTWFKFWPRFFSST